MTAMNRAARTIGALVLFAVALPGQAAAKPAHHHAFHRLSTYPVFQNTPEDTESETVAEISAVSENGKTLLYTNAARESLGFLDISNPRKPVGLGNLAVGGEPTSVTVLGNLALIAVNTSASFTAPSGKLLVVSLTDRSVKRSIDLGGQPDSIAVSKDSKYAAIAIENERDEDVEVDGVEGGLPQLPAGNLTIVDLASWTLRTVDLTGLPGARFASDPEPEYVSINSANKAAVTLQENNAIAIVDLASGTVDTSFSAGTVSLSGIDTKKDGAISLTGSLANVPREPDAVAWVGKNRIATANEGDLNGGSRGWSVFDTTTGSVTWDAGNTFERLAVRYGLHNEDRAAKKGTEPEGLSFGVFRGVPYAFVGSERSNFVAAYDMSRPDSPQFRQVLPSSVGPEGILPIPQRGLLAVSTEVDSAEDGVRGTVQLFALRPGTPAFPSIQSAGSIGWGALSGLSAVPGQRNKLYTVTDSFYSPTRILTVDTGQRPALITGELTVTKDGTPIGYDAEGIAARRDGGFWLASEGKTGPENRLVRLNASGAVIEEIPLPANVTDGLTKYGLEGIAAMSDRGREQVFVALQLPRTGDPANTARIGRYDVASKSWTWFAYPLEQASSGWVGLSELIVVDSNTLAVVERDNQVGDKAKIKRVYAFDIPAAGATVSKKLVVDLLPRLTALNGWTQEKVEGLAIGGDGELYAVTDNDGVKNEEANGETAFLRL